MVNNDCNRGELVWLEASQVWARMPAKQPMQAAFKQLGCKSSIAKRRAKSKTVSAPTYVAITPSAVGTAPVEDSLAPRRQHSNRGQQEMAADCRLVSRWEAQDASVSPAAPALHADPNTVLPLADPSSSCTPQKAEQAEPYHATPASAASQQGLQQQQAPLQHSQAPAERNTSFPLAEELSSSEAGGDGEELYEALPTCPICLADIYDVREKAVVLHCMHVFCLPCLTRWARLKHVCPLCKGCITGYLYNIISATDYQERLLPPAPPISSPSPSHTLTVVRPTPGVDFGSSEAVRRRYGLSSGDHRSTAWRSSQARCAAPQRQRSGGAVQEPRPYYRRLQQHLHAHLQAGHGQQQRQVAEVRAVSQDTALMWRRRIYEQDLWAVPLVCSGGGAVRPGASRERRLDEWIDRELRAIFQNEDVVVVRSFVLGLVSSYGLLQPALAGSLSPQRQTGGECSREGGPNQQPPAVVALQPFLMQHAEHFWHELRSFATAPYSITTYDRVVQYAQRDSPASNDSAASATSNAAPPPETLAREAASCGAASVRRRWQSRWDIESWGGRRQREPAVERRHAAAGQNASAAAAAGCGRSAEAAPAQQPSPSGRAESGINPGQEDPLRLERGVRHRRHRGQASPDCCSRLAWKDSRARRSLASDNSCHWDDRIGSSGKRRRRSDSGLRNEGAAQESANLARSQHSPVPECAEEAEDEDDRWQMWQLKDSY